MPQFTFAGPARVALGGRWHEIEEENRALGIELNAWRSEAARAQEASEAARSEQSELQSQRSLAEEAQHQSQGEVVELQSENAFLRRALGEAAEASAALECRADDLNTEHDRFFTEFAAMQQSLAMAE